MRYALTLTKIVVRITGPGDRGSFSPGGSREVRKFGAGNPRILGHLLFNGFLEIPLIELTDLWDFRPAI